MKEAEYFQQARDDADFRRTKIVEMKEQKKTLGWMLVSFGALMAVLWVVGGLVEGRWNQFGSMFSSLIIVAWLYANSGTRLAALEAMEGSKTTAPTERPVESRAS